MAKVVNIMMRNIILGFVPAGFSHFSYAADCYNGSTPSGYAYLLHSASVQNIGVKGDKATATVFSGSCSHNFYFSKTENQMFSLLLAAKTSGATVKVYFLSDGNSVGHDFGGEIYTHEMVGAEVD